MHARSMQDYAIQLRDLQTSQSQTLQTYLNQLNGRVNIENRLSELGTQRDRVAAEGFTAEEERELRNLGMDEAEMASLRENFADIEIDHDFATMTAMATA